MTAHKRSLSSPEMAVLALRHEGAGMRPVASERSLEHLASLRRGDREEEELLQVSQRRSNPAPPWGHPWCQPPMPTGGRAHLASIDSYRPNPRPQSVLIASAMSTSSREGSENGDVVSPQQEAKKGESMDVDPLFVDPTPSFAEIFG